jgi:hypothetical protein
MSLFHTSSSLTTINSIDNYISFFPCHISPSIIDHKSEIYQKNLENYKSNLNENDKDNSEFKNTLEAYYQNSTNKLNKRLFEINLKTLSSKYSSVGSNDLKNKKNDQGNYEHSLVKRLYASKNDSEALQMMSKLWKSVKFCDLIIMIGSVQYLAHRIVLALYSQKYRYFVHFGVQCSD